MVHQERGDGAPPHGGASSRADSRPTDAGVSYSYLREVLASTPDCVLVFDREGRCRFVNAAGASLWGSTPEALRGTLLSTLDLPAEATAPVERDVLSVLSTGQTVSGLTSLTQITGVRDLEYTLSPIRAADGSVDAVLLIARDVTERQRGAMAALAESEARFRATFEQAAVGLAHVGLDGKFLRLNEKLVEVFGYGREELQGLTFQEITYPEDLEADLQQMYRLLSGEIQTYTMDKRYVRKDGSRVWGRLTGSLVRTADGKPDYFIAVVEDVSQPKRLEEERERLLYELEERVHERERNLERVRQVMDLSVEVLGETTVAGLLQRVVDGARHLTRARAAKAACGFKDGGFAFAATSQSEKGPTVPPGEPFPFGQGGVYMDLIYRSKVIRLTGEELRGRAEWRGLPGGHPELNGLLGASLVGRDGSGNGMIAVTGREEGEFTDEDEALLVQLAALASLGLRHIEAHGESERRAAELDATFASIADGVIVFDSAGNPLRVNPAVIAAYGFDPVGREWGSVIRQVEVRHLDGSTVSREQLPSMRALGGETVAGESYVFRNASGADTAVVVSASPLVFDGQIRGAVTVWHDVTEREELLETNARQRRLLEAIFATDPGGLAVMVGHDLRYEMVNPAYCALTPTPTESLLGRTYAEVWEGSAALRLLPVLEQVLRDGNPADFENEMQPALGGAARYFTLHLRHVRWNDEPAVLAVHWDTTEQVRSRLQVEELAVIAQRRAAELQSVVDSMVDGVFVSDAQGTLVMANAAAARLLGMDGPDAIVGTPVGMDRGTPLLAVDGRALARQEHPLMQALAGNVVQMEDAFIHNNLTGRDSYVRLNASPIRDDEGRVVGAVAVARDVTDLAELDRLKGQFVAVAAHELRTPVTIMKGYAQALLRTSDDLPPARRKMLDAIDRGSDRIDAIVNDLLDIARLESGKLDLDLRRVDLRELVEEVVDRMALTLSKHRIILVRADPIVVQADRYRLEQVLANLLDNAVRYSPDGGDVEVVLARTGHEAVLSVRDFGVGIPTSKQTHIFQRFYRAHTDTPYDYGGMGVGLYISQQVVARHRGRMWFESAEGRGSTFYVCLPIRGATGGV